MKEEKGAMKDPGMMKEGKDAMTKDKMKTDKSSKATMPDEDEKRQQNENG